MLGINLKYLPIKAHYFAFFAANSSILPFLPSVAIQFGATPGIIGIIYASLPFFILAAKPTFGVLADKLQQKKAILITCLIITLTAFFCIMFIPSKEEEKLMAARGMWCNSKSSELGLCHLSKAEVAKVLKKVATASCNFTCNLTSTNPIAQHICRLKPLSCPFLKSKSKDLRSISFSSKVNLGGASRKAGCLMYTLKNMEIDFESIAVPICANATNIPCSVQCNHGFPPPISKKSTGALNRQIILMWILMIVGFSFMSSSIALADAIVIGLLPHIGLYGRQRLFGPMGYGTLSIITGKLVDAVSTPGQPLNFKPIYFISLALYVTDVFIVSRLDVRRVVKPKNLFRHVCRLFSRAETFLFAAAVFAIGFFTGVLWTFLIVYAYELGASQFLIGMIYTVESFFGEIPFMFVSSWFLKKIGHGHAMTLVLAVFSVRFVLYSLVYNPWLLLPIETSQGICFGIFFTALATYTSLIAPPSTHATMQSILQALFEGLGIGMGSLVGGILYESLGSHMMWLTFGVSLGVLSVVHGLILIVIQRARKSNKSTKENTEDSSDADDGADANIMDLEDSLRDEQAAGTSKPVDSA